MKRAESKLNFVLQEQARSSEEPVNRGKRASQTVEEQTEKTTTTPSSEKEEDHANQDNQNSEDVIMSSGDSNVLRDELETRAHGVQEAIRK